MRRFEVEPLDLVAVRHFLEEARLRSVSATYLLRRGHDVALYLSLALATVMLCAGPGVIPFLVLAWVIGKRGEIEIALRGDGMRIRLGMKKPRFVRYDDVVDVEAAGAWVRIHLKSGETRKYRFGLNVWQDAGDAPAQLASRFREDVRNLRELARDALTGVEISWLEHSKSTPRAWLASLRSIGAHQAAGASAFRSTHVAREALWRVLECGVASPTQRVAASIAIGSMASETVRARLRRAAEECGDARVAQTIAAVASGADDATLVSLLAAGERGSTSP